MTWSMRFANLHNLKYFLEDAHSKNDQIEADLNGESLSRGIDSLKYYLFVNNTLETFEIRYIGSAVTAL